MTIKHKIKRSESYNIYGEYDGTRCECSCGELWHISTLNHQTNSAYLCPKEEQEKNKEKHSEEGEVKVVGETVDFNYEFDVGDFEF